MTAAGWHPDPAGAPGRLRWWDGQAWTDHVHEQAAPVAPPAATSPLDASVLVVGPPRVATPGTRVFELADAAGGRLGRLVETSRGVNDSAFGAALSRSRGWQHATTRELRGPRGYPEIVLAWGPSTPGLVVVTLPDRRELGRLALDQGPSGPAERESQGPSGPAERESQGPSGPAERGTQGHWSVLGADGRPLGAATPTGVVGGDGQRLCDVVPDGSGGWRATIEGGPRPEPLRSLLAAAAVAADVL